MSDDRGARCPAHVLMHDDRWGGFRSQCEGQEGHVLPHTIAFDACEPKAWLSWLGSHMKRAEDETGE